MRTRSAVPTKLARSRSYRPSDQVQSEGYQDGDRVRRVRIGESSRGRLRIVLQRVAGGLYVEREDVPRRGLRACISFEFASRTDFLQWLGEDASRFEHPLLHQRVLRDADELWKLDA